MEHQQKTKEHFRTATLQSLSGPYAVSSRGLPFCPRGAMLLEAWVSVAWRMHLDQHQTYDRRYVALVERISPRFSIRFSAPPAIAFHFERLPRARWSSINIVK